MWTLIGTCTDSRTRNGLFGKRILAGFVKERFNLNVLVLQLLDFNQRCFVYFGLGNGLQFVIDVYHAGLRLSLIHI